MENLYITDINNNCAIRIEKLAEMWKLGSELANLAKQNGFRRRRGQICETI